MRLLYERGEDALGGRYLRGTKCGELEKVSEKILGENFMTVTDGTLGDRYPWETRSREKNLKSSSGSERENLKLVF